MKLKITAVFNYWSMYHNVKWRLVLAVVTLIDHVKRTGREKKTERTWPRCPRWLLQACLVGWISLQTVEEVSTLHCTQTQRKIHITSTVPIDHGGDCFCNKSLWQIGGEKKKKRKKDNLCVSSTFGKTLRTDGCIYYSMCEGCRGSRTIVFALEVAPRFTQVLEGHWG